MSGVTFHTEPVDDRRLPDGQAAWVEELRAQYLLLLHNLTREARALYTNTWRQIARHNAPVILRSFVQPGQPSMPLLQIIAILSDCEMLWFDDDLRAILQCPPFSVLHTPHEVKAFGWERGYASSFVDMPLTLLIYGPNVWLNCASKCPHSGETLAFRLRMREDFSLQFEAPANDWRIWLPVSAAPAKATAYHEFHHLRPRSNAFNSPADLDTHCHYQGGETGVVYTLEQSLYLSECLISAYRYAIA